VINDGVRKDEHGGQRGVRDRVLLHDVSASHIQLVLQLCDDVRLIPRHGDEHFCIQLCGGLYTVLLEQLVPEQDVLNTVLARVCAMFLHDVLALCEIHFCIQRGDGYGACDHDLSLRVCVHFCTQRDDEHGACDHVLSLQ